VHEVDTPLAYHPTEFGAYPSRRLTTAHRNFEVLKTELTHAVQLWSWLRKHYIFVVSIPFSTCKLYRIDLGTSDLHRMRINKDSHLLDPFWKAATRGNEAHSIVSDTASMLTAQKLTNTPPDVGPDYVI
jgi:hypothetical protein